MKRVFALPVLLVLVDAAIAQTTEHVHWELTTVPSIAPGQKLNARLTATIDAGWHLYSLTTPQPGPIATRIKLDAVGATVSGYRVFQPKPERKFDPNFNRDTETYNDSAIFLLEVVAKPDNSEQSFKLTASPRYQVCSATSCIPPVTRTASASVRVDAAAVTSVFAIPSGYSEVADPTGLKRKQVAASDAGTVPARESPWTFLLTAFGFGLAAIFTPCVFPMIPITMSYFLNQQSGAAVSRSSGVRQAILFCLGIIVLFSAMGLLATSLLGPFGVVQLGSNPWVNGLIALIFVAFGLSLLGAYEITIPSFILTKLDSASRGGGTAGTLLMGLTFSLASFACVGPFVGTLLAASVTEGGWRPLAGMAMFASGLALPFFLFALFPSYLNKLPRSGGWLARVKVVMGFIILAAALKYVASIDQVLQWGFLTRERFLAAWIVLFAMAGLYLLGFVQLEGINKDEPLGLGRLFAGIALTIFAVTLVPGMFGGRLGELEGFVPPPIAGASSGAGGETQLAWLKNDFNGAIAQGRSGNKRVLVNFTGYACTNCHWMKQNMFTRPEVNSLLRNIVLVDLYTDGEDAASQANQQLEQNDFHTIAIPFYVLYDASGATPQVVATFPGLTRDAAQYISFLKTPAKEAPIIQKTDLQTTLSVPDLPGVNTLAGAAIDAKSLSGKVVVANFWATWCVPCRREIPEFNKLQDALGARGLQVIGISLDEDGVEAIQPFLVKNPINYTLGLATQPTKDSYKLDELPVTVVFDRHGQIADRFQGYTEPGKIIDAVQKVL